MMEEELEARAARIQAEADATGRTFCPLHRIWDCDKIHESYEEKRNRWVEEFKNYGMLLDTMTPQELAVQIGESFIAPKQAALLAHITARIIRLEMRQT